MQFLKAPRDSLKGACRGHSLLELFRAGRSRNLQVGRHHSSAVWPLAFVREAGSARALSVGRGRLLSAPALEESAAAGFVIAAPFNPPQLARWARPGVIVWKWLETQSSSWPMSTCHSR